MAAPTLREAYQDENLQKRIQYSCTVPLETLLSSTDGWEDHPDKVHFLDSLADRSDRSRSYASYLLSEFDPEFVLENYGEEVAVWTVANAGTLRVNERFRTSLEKLAGYDSRMLEQSRLWCWRRSFSTKANDVIAQYAIAHAIHTEGLTDLDLPALLQDSARPGVTLSDKRLNDYSLIPLKAEKRASYPDGYAEKWAGRLIGNLSYSIWLDTPVGFALTYKGLPQAVAGVSTAKHQSDELMIYQMQGVQAAIIDPETLYGSETVIGKKSSRGLAPLDWRKLMVGVVENLAQQRKKRSIGIQSGKQNKWIETQSRDDEPHMSVKSAVSAYDKPAKRLGFKKGKDGNWHRPIEN